MRKFLLGLVIGIALNYGIAARAGIVFPPSTPALSGTTGNIGGSLLAVGGCSTGTVSIPGARIGMSVTASPNTFPGTGYLDFAYVSANDIVTVGICAIIIGVPTASTYSVRVMQ